MSVRGSGDASPPIDWHWDPARRMYYYVDTATGQYIYQNGTRISLTQSTPRSAQLAAALPESSGEQVSAGSQMSSEYQIGGCAEFRRTVFQRQSRTFFKRFRVFAVQANNLPNRSGISVLSNLYPMNANDSVPISGIQRYVVISVPEGDPGFVWALPIASYGGQGTSADRVKKHEHGVVHTDRVAPDADPNERPVRGELPMLPGTVRVQPSLPDERLHQMSRINYGQPTRIHVDTPVYEIGVVHKQSEVVLLSQFNYVEQEHRKQQQQSSSRPPQRQEAYDFHVLALQTQAAFRRLQQKGCSEEEIWQRLIVQYQSLHSELSFDAARAAVRRLLAYRPPGEL